MSKEVRDMFASIAGRYDLANDVLSCGMHRLWRKKIVRQLRADKTKNIIDLCCGTGDVAFAIAKTLGPQAQIIGIDFVQGMVDIAERKRKTQCPTPAPITFVRGDALSIPIADNFADALTVSFGIRNVDNVSACITEIGRVLKPEGRLVILEFGQVVTPGLKTAYNLYSRRLMPLIGWALTGNKEAYEYLPETALRFPAGEQFLQILRALGWSNLKAEALLGGLAYVYTGNSPVSSGVTPA